MNMDTYTYRIGDNLYINLTNRCTNNCTFCVRNGKERYEGYALWLCGGEPSPEAVKAEIGDPKQYSEVVFCGFGEPTERLEDMLLLCRYVKERGGKTRLNTNGHGSHLAGRNIAPELSGLVDGVNVSLNAPTEEEYNALCRPHFEGAFRATVTFARECREAGLNVWFSVVDCIGEEKVKQCKKIADGVGISLRVREMIE